MSVTAKEKLVERLFERKGLIPSNKRTLQPGQVIVYWFDREVKAKGRSQRDDTTPARQARALLIEQRIAAESYGTWVKVYLDLEEERQPYHSKKAVA
jgi:hypothetical protein